jgi:hypothetical protein
MDRQRPTAFRFAVAKNLMWPPAFEISATPDRHLPDVRQFQCTIDPASATPTWGANIPIRMIIKRNQRNGFMRPSKPESGQMMKVARTIDNESGETRLNLAIKLFNCSGRSGETKTRTPIRCINRRQTVCDVAPGAVEIEMNGKMICVHRHVIKLLKIVPTAIAFECISNDLEVTKITARPNA